MTTTAPERTQEPTSIPSRGVRQTLREHRVFFAATAAVMLHIADDNFFQPEPGVSPSDHLVSGLVPLGLLALGAAAYPRVRAGARAVVAIVFGLIGLMVGLVEAGYYTVTVGPAGDDYTGLLAGAAAIALFALAAVTLWRTRKPGRAGPAATCAGPCSGWLPWRSSASSRAARDELPEHPCPHGRGARGPPRRGVRGRHVHHERRPRDRGLVRAVAQRRRGDHPRPDEVAAARADAHRAWVRRIALRPARGGCQRGRPQPLRLGRLPRHPRCRRVPAGPAGRRPRPDRWPRTLRLRRDAAPGGRREHGPGRRGLRGRRLPLAGRGLEDFSGAMLVRGFHILATKQAA